MGTNCCKIHEGSLVDFGFHTSFIISSTNTETCNRKGNSGTHFGAMASLNISFTIPDAPFPEHTW